MLRRQVRVFEVVELEGRRSTSQELFRPVGVEADYGLCVIDGMCICEQRGALRWKRYVQRGATNKRELSGGRLASYSIESGVVGSTRLILIRLVLVMASEPEYLAHRPCRIILLYSVTCREQQLQSTLLLICDRH